MNLGDMYMRGYGVQQNFGEAATWYRKICDRAGAYWLRRRVQRDCGPHGSSPEGTLTAAGRSPERRGLGSGGRPAKADVLQGPFYVGVSENLVQPPGGRSAQRDQRGERVAAVVVEVCRRDAGRPERPRQRRAD